MEFVWFIYFPCLHYFGTFILNPWRPKRDEAEYNKVRALQNDENTTGGKRHAMKLRVGDKAPDFTATSHLDKDVTLSEYRGQIVVLAFFPQAWTPV